jgi:hypothetical protein
VLFPEPDGPTIRRQLPAGRSNVTSATAAAAAPS